MIGKCLQFSHLGIAGFVFVEEGLLVEEAGDLGGGLLEQLDDAAVGLRAELVEQRGEV